MATGQKPKRYAPEGRERAVRLVKDHLHEYDSQWAAIHSIAEKIGCSSEALRNWVRQDERNRGNRGERGGLSTDDKARLRERELERENRELKRANEILRKASAFFAAVKAPSELDRRPR